MNVIDLRQQVKDATITLKARDNLYATMKFYLYEEMVAYQNKYHISTEITYLYRNEEIYREPGIGHLHVDRFPYLINKEINEPILQAHINSHFNDQGSLNFFVRPNLSIYDKMREIDIKHEKEQLEKIFEVKLESIKKKANKI